MSAQPSDFLLVADNCLQDTREIFLRSAVSRAYYGAYHHVLGKMNGPIPHYSTGSHDRLIVYLKSPEAATQEPNNSVIRKRLSYMLAALKTERCIADYELNQSVIDINAVASVENARRIIAMI